MATDFYELLKKYRNAVLIGESGSGKSEVAVNIAEHLSGNGIKVDFFDLDQSKPLFRSRDEKERLESLGIHVYFEHQLLDTPIIVGGVSTSLSERECFTILDIGGNDIGSRMIGRFSKLLNKKDTLVIYLINPFRPWTSDQKAVAETLQDIKNATHLQNMHFMANPNLGNETRAEDFIAGIESAATLLPQGAVIEGAFVKNDIYESVKDKVEMPLMPLTIRMTYEWQEL